MIIRFRGLDLGDGSDFIVTAISGWDSTPEIYNGSVPRTQRPGSWVGRIGASKRVVTIDLMIPGVLASGNVNTVPRNALRDLYSEGTEEFELYMDLDYDNPPEVIYARLTNLTMNHSIGYGQMQLATLEFTATDPRRYRAQTIYAQSAAPAAAQGFTSWPVTYGAATEPAAAVGAASAVQATNTGSAPTNAIYVIQGSSISVTSQGGAVSATRFPVSGPITIDTRLGIAVADGRDISHLALGAPIRNLQLMPGTSTVSGEGGVQITWQEASV